MEQKQGILSVKNLSVSFRTEGGKVQAVRDISFELYKGETLALVGESGSGKSVTTRAIMGILAGNALKEGGEILYDGQDLTRLSEEGFHKIRGDKIAMIFQDPMSALNPIMRVGKQLTEAMLIKGKQAQRQARREFNAMIKELNVCMDAARGEHSLEENARLCENFDRFEREHLRLQQSYLAARETAEGALGDIDDILLKIEKSDWVPPRRALGELVSLARGSVERFVVNAQANRLVGLLEEAARQRPKKDSLHSLTQKLRAARGILAEAVAADEPDFFAMGYFLTFSGKPLPELPVAELNIFLRRYLDENFMFDFIAGAREGVAYSQRRAVENSRRAIAVIDENISAFGQVSDKWKKRGAEAAMIAAVEKSIDRLNPVKDNLSYTFPSALKSAAKRGDEEGLSVVRKMRERLVCALQRAEECDFNERTVALIGYLKEKASGVAHRVTRRAAKNRALKLLDEVGIPEPRRRFRQYPFEFSGGMRQRIVIAIALSANPEILICDEPTTALDVTIQAQILELINKVKSERRLSVIFITHDLGVVANMADRVAVMYAGKIVEIGSAEEIFYTPAHPYTWALLASMPDLDTKGKLSAIAGTPPDMSAPPQGDAFAERNPYAMQIDFERQPPTFEISPTHSAASWLLHPDAPRVSPPKAVTDRIAAMKKKREGRGER